MAVGSRVLVEIYSDVICPWCYIGKRRFEAALAEFGGGDEVQVVWRPYQLDPTAPRVPTPVVDAYARKFGGPQRAAQIIGHVTSVAREVALDFRLERAQRANTFDAHRLLAWAESSGHQDHLAERLFRAYFVEGADVADRAVLADLAGEVGLDAETARSVLESDALAEEVRHDLARAAKLEITAVPTFVFEGRWSVPGAQEPETFVQVLRRVAERFPAASPAAAVDAGEGEACGR